MAKRRKISRNPSFPRPLTASEVDSRIKAGVQGSNFDILYFQLAKNVDISVVGDAGPAGPTY